MHSSSPNDPNVMHIGLAFDNNYVVPVYALLASIFHHNISADIVFHVIATGLENLERFNLEKYITDSESQVFFYEIDEDLVKSKTVIPAIGHFTIAVYYRLFFPSVIDQKIKRLLYLDTDIIVHGSLKNLFHIDIGGAPLGAVPDSSPFIREDLGIKEQGQYFNSGVLLINTQQWREQQVTENALKFVLANPKKVKWVDQDALNATLIGRWFRLDNKYNFTLFDVKLQVPTKELIKDKVIIHYTSSNKPWHFLTRNKLRYLYFFHLKRSPKSGEKKYVDFKWDLKKVYIFLRIRLKEFYFDNSIDKFLPVKKWMDPLDLFY